MNNDKTPTAEPVAQGEAVAPNGYHYVYPDIWGTGEVIRKNGGREVNGIKPLRAIPYWYTSPAQPRAVPDVAAMINRFLGWRLPDDFAPDAGISFTHVTDPAWTHDSWPIGTNLFTAAQAEQMFRYVLAASASQAPTYYCTHCKLPSHTDTDHADCEDAAASRAMLAAARSPGESNTADQEADR